MIVTTNAAHVAFMDDLKTTLGRHKHLTPPEMLAVASQFVGNLIALQDQRRMSPQTAMDLVAGNIQIGNHAAVERLIKPEGSA